MRDNYITWQWQMIHTNFVSCFLIQQSESDTAQLTRDKYITWQWQMITYLKAQNIYGFVEGTVLPPPQTIDSPTPSEGSTNKVANPAFLTWLQQDQMVLSIIVSTILENLISQVIGYSTSCEVWNALECMYFS
jgi:hypothetical protein